ncbi:5'/3'-nucleotidase SurE [Desulforhabdus amnigena]|jgi:5'-nucleotidase|uniref:5'-nucleotidase SurE n=1 Tax=Desulforhabdus amnigena TaxID=40218 RepID=A0A9W6FRC1_9BACT|nr:5'/3'-nucleotidase SurE [Desulforhabdus amnigena]NLJ29164.1 5'/3'-nucleotidase SurE [Deltaproteobacteria bacterium]GLI32854.1 5'-nucleotidase SurE [Desulforhabdus amnigena]
MRVLLTNDDGIYAKGIEALYLALIEEHEVTVVAPETEQSAVGHAITWLHPLRVEPVYRNGSFFGYGLDGTPADCVKIAVTELLKPPPELVVSGINLGANVGVNVIYSGTVSAATEAAVLGIPSVAVSIDSFTTRDFSAATEFVPKLIRRIQREGLPKGVSLNVNVPNVPAEKIQGVRVTHQGNMQCVESYDQRTDPRNHVYYWLRNTAVREDTDPSADSVAIAEKCISVTPIHYNLTHHETIDRLKKWDL